MLISINGIEYEIDEISEILDLCDGDAIVTCRAIELVEFILICEANARKEGKPL